MQLEYAKDPVWANAEHTMIDLTIKWDEIDEELPFTASQFDPEPHGKAIFEAASKGDFGKIGEYVEPPPASVDTEALRRAAYEQEADPLFFKYQRGEATEQEWLDKIAEIKAKYPKE
jgi:hypothetical protein